MIQPKSHELLLQEFDTEGQEPLGSAALSAIPKCQVSNGNFPSFLPIRKVPPVLFTFWKQACGSKCKYDSQSQAHTFRRFKVARFIFGSSVIAVCLAEHGRHRSLAQSLLAPTVFQLCQNLYIYLPQLYSHTFYDFHSPQIEKINPTKANNRHLAGRIGDLSDGTGECSWR